MTVLWTAIGVGAGAALVGGLIVGLTQGKGQAWRGVLIGINCGLNFGLAAWALGALNVGIATTLAAVLAAVSFLAVIRWLAYRRAYHFVLGWLSWVMPMSLPVHAVGFVLLVLSLLGHLLFWLGIGAIRRGDGIAFFRISRAGWNWKEGTFFFVGGLFGNANAYHTAYDVGGFIFIDRQAGFSDQLLGHESGHALSLAAFGSVFHLVEWFDEMVRGGRAVAERMADSNAGLANCIAQWGACAGPTLSAALDQEAARSVAGVPGSAGSR